MLSKAKTELSKIISEASGSTEELAFQSIEQGKEGFGDLSSKIAFMLAKERKENPAKLAASIAEKATASLSARAELIERVEVTGPYLNFYLSNEFYSSALKQILKEKVKFGKGKKTGKRLMVEFFHANTHKGVHIGHIRNVSLGESLSRILDFTGNEIIRANYQGDIGPHVAKCLWGYINLYHEKAPETKRGIWLGKVYSEASQKIKGNPELEKQAQEINQKLYAGDLKISEAWKQTRQWCLDDFNEFYKEFGTHFDAFYFESQVEKLGKETALDMLKNGVAKRDQGAVIMDLKDEGLGVYVLLTKEDYPLYYAKELGLVQMQFKKYDPDRLIHVVGKEQELYFKQLFKTFEKIGGPVFGKAAKASYHLIYALVMLPEGKMSSRDGTMVLYEDLRNKLLEIVKQEIRKRHEDWPQEQVDATALKITLAAIKFSMVRRESNRIMVFDWEQALNLEGDSGPYAQYAYVRTHSILSKAEGKPGTSSKYIFSPEEKKLIRRLCEFPELVQKSARDLSVQYLPEYSLDVATDFNKFYATSSVLNAETKDAKKSRLAIVQATSIVLENSLGLLGIECPEKM
ncbi:MAG: arginine--tRNA ligase [Candidatus Micrarchaeia archaeon]